jgi:hypothetical protein
MLLWGSKKATMGCHPVVISLEGETARCYGVDLFVFLSQVIHKIGLLSYNTVQCKKYCVYTMEKRPLLMNACSIDSCGQLLCVFLSLELYVDIYAKKIIFD